MERKARNATRVTHSLDTSYMELVLPSEKYKDDFIQAVKEYHSVDSQDRKDIYALKVEDLEKDFASYVKLLHDRAEGRNLPEGYVPDTTYWLIDNGKFIGRVSFRHTLTESLRKVGGHIGYDIRPSKRNKGYGKKMLALALQKARQLGLHKVLITCDETNIASKKIIEANGGVFENALEIPNEPKKLRYWITLN
jgi:predicted acetyltransferase